MVSASSFELHGDFQTDVVDASRTTPILVDFWAAWCGPCRVLGPVLESLASEPGVPWRLVKVDTEQHPDLAQQFGIRSIPAVKLFHDGRVIAEFAGSLPEHQVRTWLQQNLPREGDSIFASALELLQGGDRDGARQRLEDIVGANPDHTPARLALAQLLLGSKPAQALELASGVPNSAAEFAAAQNVALLARLIQWSAGADVDILGAADAPPDYVSLYRDGAHALREGDAEGALEKWITLMSKNRTLDDDGARRACLALFSLLGEESEVTRAWRRRFSTALY